MNKVLRPTLLLTFVVIASLCSQAQVTSLPAKMLGSESFFYYKMGKKETVQDVAAKFGTTTDAIFKYNPSVGETIVKDQMLYFPVAEFTSTPHAQNLFPGEEIIVTAGGDEGTDLATICKRHNTSLENLLDANPGLTSFTLSEGERLKVHTNTPDKVVVAVPYQQVYTHTIKKDDTFASIAMLYNVDASAVTSANPDIKKPKKGKVIYVPRTVTESRSMLTTDATREQLFNAYSTAFDNVYDQIHGSKADDVKIGIMLPFQLNKKNPPKQALLYTEFYQGFLLGVEDANKALNKEIFINVYDTENSVEVIDSLLNVPDLAGLDMLVAPGEASQIERVGAWSEKTKVNTINCFAAKDESHLKNPYMLQASIPTSLFAEKVNAFIDASFEGYSYIFIEDSSTENEGIYADIKRHANESGAKVAVLKLGNLTTTLLSNELNPGGKYLVVPSTGGKSFLSKAMPVLTKVKDSRYDCTMALLGYPEFMLSLNDYQEDFHKMNTYLVSRFFNAGDKPVKAVENRFKAAYKNAMTKSTPVMAIYGYDLAQYIVTTLAQSHDINVQQSSIGAQTDFQFVRPTNWGGFVNQAMKVANYAPGGKVNVTRY